MLRLIRSRALRRLTDNPTERANVPPGHHCVRFSDGGRRSFPDPDMQLLPELNR